MYASTFSRHAKAYVRATPFRLEEEKMAVILQQVVGSFFGARFYPDFSGVARSRNFYPVPPMAFEDGIAAVALGLGRTVVDGGKCLAFCPRYPANLGAVFLGGGFPVAIADGFLGALAESSLPEETSPPGLREVRFSLDVAEADGTLDALGSTYSADNDRITDGLGRPGMRVVTFAPILKYGVFPLAALLDELVKDGENAFGQPVEIEFAVRLARQTGESAQFGFLQIRPLVLSQEAEELQHGDGGSLEADRTEHQSAGEWARRQSAGCGGCRCATVRAGAEPGSSGARVVLQCETRGRKPAVSAGGRGTMGIE